MCITPSDKRTMHTQTPHHSPLPCCCPRATHRSLDTRSQSVHQKQTRALTPLLFSHYSNTTQRGREAYILRAPPARTYGKSDVCASRQAHKALALCTLKHRITRPLPCCCPRATLAHSTHALSRTSKADTSTHATTLLSLLKHDTQRAGSLHAKSAAGQNIWQE